MLSNQNKKKKRRINLISKFLNFRKEKNEELQEICVGNYIVWIVKNSKEHGETKDNIKESEEISKAKR